MPKEVVQAVEVLYDANAPQKQDGLERAGDRIEDASTNRMTHTATNHYFNGGRRRFQRNDIKAPVLKRKRMRTGTGSNIEHGTLAEFKPGAVDLWKSIFVEPVARRKRRVDEAVIAMQHNRGIAVSLEVVQQSLAMQVHSVHAVWCVLRIVDMCERRIISANVQALPKLYGADQSAQARREGGVEFPAGRKARSA